MTTKIYYEQLIGAKVLRVGFLKDGDEQWPTLQLQKKDGSLFHVTVSCDPEGNGPGHLIIE